MIRRAEDYLVRATALGGHVRAFSIRSTGVVSELHERHGTEPAVTAALGRLATGTLLFGAMLKERDHLVSVRVAGDGPAGTLLASANGGGEVRGLVANPRTGVEQVRNGKLDVSGVVGRQGRLTVTRDLGLRHPYVGTVELASGEIGDDFAHYLHSSEQTPSAVGLGVFVDRTGAVVAAGGWLVQLLAGLDDADAAEIEENVRSLPHPTALLRSGYSPDDVLDRIFPEGWTEQARVPVRFHCPCSAERLERALLLLGAAELHAIVEKDREAGRTEVTCEFCTHKYYLGTERMEALLAMAENRN
ncbi:MAG: Hsp33 family molecular chaperone HslO [Gemmatimonadota bacterium]